MKKEEMSAYNAGAPRQKARTDVQIREDESVEVFRPTRVDLFVDAFIRNRFNATAAAMEVFDLAGDEAQQRRTAGAMGHEYLWKPETQKKLKARMERKDISVEWVLNKIKQIADSSENEDVQLRALDRVAHFVGAEIKERSTDVSKGRNAHLNLYMELPKTERPVIEVESTGK